MTVIPELRAMVLEWSKAVNKPDRWSPRLRRVVTAGRRDDFAAGRTRVSATLRLSSR
jgi:hypothetical protein